MPAPHSTDLLERRDRDRPAPPRLLAEAGWEIVRASLAIRRRPFTRVVGALERPAGDAAPADPGTAYWIRRSVRAWGRRLPWRAKCFEQGLAAAAMLRRRGLAATLHYGAAQPGGTLIAHVWVTSGDTPVVGHENKDEFAPLGQWGV